MPNRYKLINGDAKIFVGSQYQCWSKYYSIIPRFCRKFRYNEELNYKILPDNY